MCVCVRVCACVCVRVCACVCACVRVFKQHHLSTLSTTINHIEYARETLDIKSAGNSDGGRTRAYKRSQREKTKLISSAVRLIEAAGLHQKSRIDVYAGGKGGGGDGGGESV